MSLINDVRRATSVAVLSASVSSFDTTRSVGATAATEGVEGVFCATDGDAGACAKAVALVQASKITVMRLRFFCIEFSIDQIRWRLAIGAPIHGNLGDAHASVLKEANHGDRRNIAYR